MKTNILSLSLILGIIAVAGVGMGAASPTISIVPASITGINQGDAFSVDIKVDPEGQPVRVVEINLKFDPAAVQIDSYNTILCDMGASKCSIVIGNFLGNYPMELFNDINNTNGTLHLAHVIKPRGSEVTAPGTYATLNFKVNSNASSRQSTLYLATAKLANDNGYIPGVMADNGSITIVSTSSRSSQTCSAAETASAPKAPGFSAPMALIAMIALIIRNQKRKKI
ncbi:Cohesin domain protein [uncultured archaeon]|nr:Cohesin domain protein [uncultured archaeon]